MRLLRYVQRFYGVSRRKAWELIMSGDVKVNGEVVKQPMTILKGDEVVEVKGLKPVRFTNLVYVAFNKPVGFVVSKSDKFNRTIYELLPEKFRVLNPVGRLDKNSEGLLILTNDGELIHRLTHPKYRIIRGYIVKTFPPPSKYVVEKFVEGIEDRGEILKAVRCKIIHKDMLYIELSEGKNREIRRMAKRLGLKVLMLKRIHYGNVKLDIPTGKWRYLRESEINGLRSSVGLK